MQFFTRWMCLGAVLLLPELAAAQAFPSKPIRVIVPFAAGGPADTVARIVSEKMASLLAKPVVIENRPGAGGVTGVAAVAKADPDGHTIGVSATGALAISPALQDSMPYDVFKDLRLVTQLVEVPSLLVINPNVPAKSLNELVALAKAEPGKLNFGSAGFGGTTHLGVELLKKSAGIDLVHVPYGGAAPAVNDLLGGHVQLMFADIPVLIGNVEAGKLRALAIGSAARAPAGPDVPTTAELGFPQVIAQTWYGIIAPGRTPPDVIGILQKAASDALHAPDVKDKLTQQGAIIVGSSSDDFTNFVKAELEKWGRIGREAGVKLN